jgi:hypothetical protein
VKIVYTNLREDDFGIKRSVRQFRVEFNKNPDRRALLGEGRVLDDRRGDRSALLPDHGFRSGRLLTGHDREPQEMDEGEAHLQEGTLSKPPLGGPRVVSSLAGFYIRKFVENQMRTLGDFQKRSRINIMV